MSQSWTLWNEVSEPMHIGHLISLPHPNVTFPTPPPRPILPSHPRPGYSHKTAKHLLSILRASRARETDEGTEHCDPSAPFQL